MCAMQLAQTVPFHADQCPQCKHYDSEINRCWAFLVESQPRPLLGVFKGQAKEACERYEATADPGIQSTDGEAQATDDGRQATSASPAPLTAEITCHKCKTVNPSGQVRCRSCGANLLPGEGFGQHIAYFLVGAVFAALATWLLYGVLEGRITYDLFCLKPAFLVITGGSALIWGFVKMVTPTPKFTRYAERAARHKETNPLQALADINNAIDLAPKNERTGLIKKRMEINTRLGDQQDVLRDQLELAIDPDTHRTEANLASLVVGADADVYAESSSQADKQALIDTGLVKRFGYCSKCQDAVELDANQKCPKHGRVKAVQYAVKGDETLGMLKVLEQVKRERAKSRRRLISTLAVIILLVGGCYLINYFNGRSARVVSEAPFDLNEVQPTSPAAAVLLPTPVPTAVQEITPVTFEDHQVSFEYPSDWQVIDEAGVQTLLNGTLKGIGDWEYIGGVYTKGPEDCRYCAHIVVYMVPLPAGFEGWSDEFYQRIKTNAQNSMGERLLTHRQVSIDETPGWETIYLGKSGRTKLWDQGYLPPGESLLVMVSASSSPDSFDQFLPVFEQAFGSLNVYGVAADGGSVASPQQPAAAEISGTVKGSSVKVRAGPGTDAGVVGRMPAYTEFTVLARNAAGDWLKVTTPDGVTGWVSAPLVDVPTPIVDLPVE